MWILSLVMLYFGEVGVISEEFSPRLNGGGGGGGGGALDTYSD